MGTTPIRLRSRTRRGRRVPSASAPFRRPRCKRPGTRRRNRAACTRCRHRAAPVRAPTQDLIPSRPSHPRTRNHRQRHPVARRRSARPPHQWTDPGRPPGMSRCRTRSPGRVSTPRVRPEHRRHSTHPIPRWGVGIAFEGGSAGAVGEGVQAERRNAPAAPAAVIRRTAQRTDSVIRFLYQQPWTRERPELWCTPTVQVHSAESKDD